MGIWFHEEEKPRKRPSWAAPDFWKKMTGVFVTRLMGIEYRLPITDETQPFIEVIKGNLDPWGPSGKIVRRNERRRQYLGERGIQDIISALLAQVRETEVHDAAEMLAQDIKEKLRPLLSKKIEVLITERRPGLPAPIREEFP